MHTDVAGDLVDAFEDTDTADLRVAIAYEGDDYEAVFVRDDVAERFTDEQFDEIAKSFVLKSLDDWTEQPEFAPFGHLDVVTRWFHDAVFFQVPLGEWSGVIVSFDRDSLDDRGAVVDAILDYVDDPARDLREESLDEESAVEAAEEHFG